MSEFEDDFLDLFNSLDGPNEIEENQERHQGETIIKFNNSEVEKKLIKIIYSLTKLNEKCVIFEGNLREIELEDILKDEQLLEYYLTEQREIFEDIVSDNKNSEIWTLNISDFEDYTVEDLKLIGKIEIQNLEINNLQGMTDEKLKALNRIKTKKIEGDLFDAYTDNELLEIKNIFDKIKSQIPKEATELEKFAYLYKTIAMFTDFDERGSVGSEEHVEGREKITRSLMGVFVEGEAVCAGYSLGLDKLCEYIGIECKRLDGKAYFGNKIRGGHAWNQIKIDGQWYNCDLTWDYRSIRNGNDLEFCLRGDQFFSEEHRPDYDEERENCNADYDRKKIKDIFEKIKCTELDKYMVDATTPKNKVDKEAFRAATEKEYMTENTLEDLREIIKGQIEKENNSKDKEDENERFYN